MAQKITKKGPHMLVEAGEENAGLVDIGDGLACAFKIESHNHPSAVEPYQGAATGVGGINRDIFTMGARPIAQLNSLRFGNPTEERTKWLVKGVSKGIGDYGNSFGIPIVGGEVYFDECYHQNPLVNAFSAGIVEVGKQISATSTGVGNPVFIVGPQQEKMEFMELFLLPKIWMKIARRTFLPCRLEIHSKRNSCLKLLWNYLKPMRL